MLQHSLRGRGLSVPAMLMGIVADFLKMCVPMFFPLPLPLFFCAGMLAHQLQRYG